MYMYICIYVYIYIYICSGPAFCPTRLAQQKISRSLFTSISLFVDESLGEGLYNTVRYLYIYLSISLSLSLSLPLSFSIYVFVFLFLLRPVCLFPTCQAVSRVPMRGPWSVRTSWIMTLGEVPPKG